MLISTIRRRRHQRGLQACNERPSGKTQGRRVSSDTSLFSISNSCQQTTAGHTAHATTSCRLCTSWVSVITIIDVDIFKLSDGAEFGMDAGAIDIRMMGVKTTCRRQIPQGGG
jgi:hypothetical protein